MKKRILFAILGVILIIAVLAGIKTLQIRSMIDSGKKFVAAHQNLADKVLARDIEGAQVMLASHLHSTLDFVYPTAKKDQS